VLTLDEMLALLPDNDEGEIGAGDMRQIVTDLYTMATSFGQVFSYRWSVLAGTPSTGEVTTDAWSMAASELKINETTSGSQSLSFGVFDDAESASVWLVNATGSRMRARVDGPSVDHGSWRSVPITALEVRGAAPANNSKVNVAVWLNVVPELVG